ncbi:hypothetical protein ACH196_12670 [Mesorhizobium sp. IMUNJ23232]
MSILPNKVIDWLSRAILRQKRILLSVIRVISRDERYLDELMTRNSIVANLGKNTAFIRKLLKAPDSFEFIVKFIATNSEALRKVLTHPEIHHRIGGQAEFLDRLATSKAATRRIVSSDSFFDTLSQLGEDRQIAPIASLLREPRVFEAVIEFMVSKPDAVHQFLLRTCKSNALKAQGEFLEMLSSDPDLMSRLLSTEAAADTFSRESEGGPDPLAALLRHPAVHERAKRLVGDAQGEPVNSNDREMAGLRS